MAITSLSTYAEVLAQYNDNLAWDGNTTKAALALEAVRWLLVNRTQSFTKGDHSSTYSTLEKEKEKLEKYIETFGAANSTKIATFTRGKMLT